MIAKAFGRQADKTRMRDLQIRGLAVLMPFPLLFACAVTNPSTAGEPPSWDARVQVHGALRAMFHEGQTGAMVRLDSLLPNPYLYAVGALADLSGEVTVLRGRAYLAYPEGAHATRTETTLEPDAAATLLVTSEVPAWKSVVTDHAIGFERLDDEIMRLAAAAGMNRSARFPFLLEGTFEGLQWHVIDGRRLSGGGSSHQDHLAAAVRSERDRATGTIVGFYSESDQGVFTHKGLRTHMHCVVDVPPSAGHVDRVDLPAGITIKFPVDSNKRPNKAMQRTGAAGR